VHAEVRREAAKAHLVEAIGVEEVQRGSDDERATVFEGFRRAEPSAATTADLPRSGGSLFHSVDN
jgi:hypothetical protein